MRNILALFVFAVLLLNSCNTPTEKTLFELRKSDATGVTFTNTITENDSINILTEEYIFNGGGVAIGDFNNDAKPDLFFTGNQVTNKLYLNTGNLTFKDVSKAAAIEASEKWSTGIAVADINSDGWLDIYVCAAMLPSEAQRANMLFVHQGLDKEGNPKFKEMASDYGIAETRNSMGATFFDYDKDGLLDLYVLNNEQVHALPTNYRPIIKDGTAVSNDRLYHNNGDGTFTDVTLEAGILYEGFGLGIAVADLNYDGWPDLHISNDYLTNDLLYINNQDGTFSNNIQDFLKHQSKFSMGSDISDFNNDGYLDIVTLDMLGETNHRMKTTIGNNNYISYTLTERFDYEYQYGRNMLHVGNGPGIPYSEIGLMAGISKTDWSWSPLFVDVDNDGFRDLLITNGFPRDITDKDFGDYNLSVSQYLSPSKILDSIPVAKIPNYAYKNMGEGIFTDVGTKWGINFPSFSNGAAFADLDADGDVDYVVNNINEEAFIFENTLNDAKEPQNQFLKIALKGSKNNILGLGTKIVLRFSDDDFQYYEHRLTRGYMSSVEPTIHFGLGKHKEVKSLEVLWSDGSLEVFENVKSNQTLSIAHNNAAKTIAGELNFPFVQKTKKTYFKEVARDFGIDFKHIERDIIDYNVQRTLPHKLSQNGPCIAVGDLNQDGLEDFIVGSAAEFSPTIFLQNADGSFEQKPMFNEKLEMQYEEEGIVLFDLENDGDLDLYLVSGSNEFPEGSDQYTDRLMVNNGKGEFRLAQEKMPAIQASGSVVRAHDFDQDGFVDLFIGGRTPHAQYPYPEKSFLLKNEEGILKDVTRQMAPELEKIGMVTDALWEDIDSDGLSELILVGEYMPVTILKNGKTSFKRLQETGIGSFTGWWESIEKGDFDNDGDMDFVVGNLGSNNFYQPTAERPVTVLAKDFDDNGRVDPVMFAYLKNQNGQDYAPYPVAFWGDMFGQSPLFRSKFNRYKEYAKVTQSTLFTKEELEGVKELTANYDRSSYIENLGNMKFKISSLPMPAQAAPINDILVGDFNKDQNLDMLLIGNDYGNEIFIGRYDAFNGLLLEGDGQGRFNPIPGTDSGFLVSGDAKAIAQIASSQKEPLYLVTQNNGKLLVFRKNNLGDQALPDELE